MNRSDFPIPPELRERLERASNDERRSDLERVWALLGRIDDPTADTDADSPDSEAAWQAVQDRVQPPSQNGTAPASPDPATAERAEDRSPQRPSSRQRHLPSWTLVAAAAVVLVVAGLWMWSQPERVTTEAGEMTAVTLPDGSAVELNSATTLSYPRGLATWPLIGSDERAVTLQGEAFFEVEPGETPFVVETPNARVEALGTSFNVRARSEGTELETHVALASGSVQIGATESTPAQPIVLDREGAVGEVVGDVVRTSSDDEVGTGNQAWVWREQGFAASDRSLGSIFDDLERRFGVTLTLTDSTIAQERMTLFYPSQTDLETILHDISVAKDLEYRETSTGFELAPAGSPSSDSVR